jgi:hypothetical protein
MATITIAQQIAALQLRANAEAQVLIDAEKARVATENISGSKLEDAELASKFDDLQDAINASAPHATTYIFTDLLKHVLSAIYELHGKVDALTPADVTEPTPVVE